MVERSKKYSLKFSQRARKMGAGEFAWGNPYVLGARKSSSIATFGERT